MMPKSKYVKKKQGANEKNGLMHREEKGGEYRCFHLKRAEEKYVENKN